MAPWILALSLGNGVVHATVAGMLRHEQSVATYLYRLAEEVAAR